MNSLSIKAISSIVLVFAICFTLVTFDFAVIALLLNTAGILASVFYLKSDISEAKDTNDIIAAKNSAAKAYVKYIKYYCKSRIRCRCHERIRVHSHELENALDTAIRGLQFGDLNGQNLQFTVSSIAFIREQIQNLSFGNAYQTASELHDYLETMKTRKTNSYNPVSATNMVAGDIDLF
jgi:methyl-accepting chemotaxis protein